MQLFCRTGQVYYILLTHGNNSMNEMNINLIPFEEHHLNFLSSEVTSSKFLIQWAGPKYKLPLTWIQFQNRITEKDNGEAVNHLFLAANSLSNEPVGFVELRIKDSISRLGLIGSVLVFQKWRGLGAGKMLVKEICRFGFINIELKTLILNVFDFNIAAIEVYKKLGFNTTDNNYHTCNVEGETWKSFQMSLSKEGFQELCRTRMIL